MLPIARHRLRAGLKPAQWVRTLKHTSFGHYACLRASGPLKRPRAKEVFHEWVWHMPCSLQIFFLYKYRKRAKRAVREEGCFGMGWDGLRAS